MIEITKWKCEECGSIFNYYYATRCEKCQREVCPNCWTHVNNQYICDDCHPDDFTGEDIV